MQDITNKLSDVFGGMGPGGMGGQPGGGMGGQPGGMGGGGLGGGGANSITGNDIMNAQPANNMAMPSRNGGGGPQFSSPNMNVTSPQDNSWMNSPGLNAMFNGMK